MQNKALSKKFAVFWLLLVLLAAPVTTIWLRKQGQMIKKEVKRKLLSGVDKLELVLLTITDEDAHNLVWKHKKEFEWKGQMYDVVRFERKSNSTDYYCWWDHEETALFKRLSRLLSIHYQKNDKQKSNTLNVDHFIKNLVRVNVISGNYICFYRPLEFYFPLHLIRFYPNAIERPPALMC